jgi:hypothetical protein
MQSFFTYEIPYTRQEEQEKEEEAEVSDESRTSVSCTSLTIAANR